MIVCHDPPYVFISNAKCGTHSVHWALTTFYGGSAVCKVGLRIVPRQEYGKQWKREIGAAVQHPRYVAGHPNIVPKEFATPKHFKFSVVRDPYTRIVSAWRSMTGPGRRFEGKVPGKNTLQNFISWALTTKRSYAAVKPQVEQLAPLERLQTVLRLENLAEDWKKLPFYSGQPESWPAKDSALSFPGEYTNGPEEELSPEDVKIVNLVYARDFEAFGYPVREG